MNPARMALRRPVTWIVVWLAVALAGIFAFNRIRKDIFPVLDLPVLYVCQPYGGMDPGQMEGWGSRTDLNLVLQVGCPADLEVLRGGFIPAVLFRTARE